MAASLCGKRLFLSRGTLLKTPKRNGYIILLPEIGEDSPQKDPLLKEDKLPEFSKFTIEKCIAAIARQTVDFEELIKSYETKLEGSENIDLFNDLFHSFEEAYVPLETTLGISKTLYFGNQSLMPEKSFRSIYERARRAAAARFISEPLYHACLKALNTENSELTVEQKRILSKYTLNGKLNGLDLVGKKRGWFQHSAMVVSSKCNEFSEKLQISTKIFSHTIKKPEMVKDFPDDLLKSTATDPTQPHVGPWIITLQSNIYNQFMEFCSDRSLRQEVWEAYVTRGSMLQERLLQTSTPLEEIRFRRIEQAKYLNYESYAHLSMETKMAGTIQNLYNVLDTLLETAFPAQKKEISQLNEFAKERRFEGTLQVWDLPYWSRKQYRSLYEYTDDDIRKYFPLPKVLSGLFELTETLFNIRIIENKKADVWHPDVRFFDVFDLNGSSEQPIAHFYLDPYARHSEKELPSNEGWHVGLRNKSVITNTTPISSLIFSFQPPAFGKPSLLTFSDVRTLFQKFGHGLHCLLTTVSYSEIAGLSNVEWDAAQVSDYFMENWVYEPSTLRLISSHYETGEALPEEMISTLKNSRTYLAGYQLCNQLYLSRIDLELHRTEEFWVSIIKRLWKQHFVFPLHKHNLHVCSFEAIFSGGYGAAFYSFLWSNMLAADAFSAFHEVPNEDINKQKEIANRYRQTFLSMGGSYPASEIFRRFRGRDPSPAALFNNLGLESVKKE